MASIWHNDEKPGYLKGKAHTSYSKWRVLVMERTAQLTGLSENDAVTRMHTYGQKQMGLDFDKGVTAEELAQKLAQ